MGNTIFDRILSRQIPATILFEDDVALAFADVNPQAPVHVLVIPKRKIVSFAQLTDQDATFVGEYMQRIAKVAAQLGLEDGGYRVVFNTGKEGGQTVEYIHAHILGKRNLGWPPG